MNFLKYFRPHIIFSGGSYLVRKFSITGWVYLDHEDPYWWHVGKSYIGKYKTQKEAEQRYEELKEKTVKIL